MSSKRKKISYQQLGQIFVACMIPIHLWAYLGIFYAFPGWVLHFSTWDLTGILSYHLIFALFESLFVTGGFGLLAIMLPRKVYGEKLVPINAGLILCGSLVAAIIHLNKESMNREDIWLYLLLFLPIAAIFIGLTYVWIRRSATLDNWIRIILDRLAILAWAYVTIDFIALLIVIIRNINFG